jgi:hypothetical protein
VIISAVYVGLQSASAKGATQVVTKIIVENDKVRAQEVTFPPGAASPVVATSSVRVVRALAGGKLQRTYTDGRKEEVVFKTGQVRINEVSPAYTAKNVGKSTVRLYVVVLK